MVGLLVGHMVELDPADPLESTGLPNDQPASFYRHKKSRSTQLEYCIVANIWKSRATSHGLLKENGMEQGVPYT